MTGNPTFPDATAPVVEPRPFEEVHHGIVRRDDYAWLRADNWQEVFRDPSLLASDIRAHLEAENAYQAAMMAGTEELRRTLVAEMRGRIKEDDSSVPLPHGPWAYGSSYVTGGEQPRLFRVPRRGGDQQLLLDGDAEGVGKAYFRLGGSDHSPDHRLLLWAYDDAGSEFYTLRVRDIGTGADQPQVVTDTGGGGVWDAAGEGFFYTRLDSNHRPSRVFYHRLGTDQAEDRLIFEEPDAGYFVNVGGTRADDWITIGVGDHETSEYLLIPARDPLAAPTLVAARRTGIQYDIEEGGEEFFILTNVDGAKDFKIMSAPVSDPSPANWREVVPHRPGVLILSVLSFRDFLVRLERQDGLPRIVVRDRESGEEHAISFEEEAFSLGLGGSLEYDTDVMRFSYSSMTTPTQLFDYDMRTRTRTLLKTQEVPSGHDPAHYVTRRLMAPSHDGELVPVSVLYHRDTPLDGSAPLLLYGYGAYGITVPAAFNTNCLSLVDRGLVYAIAHVRGGKDKGYAWYEDGKRATKPNTFHDFVAAARHLAREGYTSEGRIVAQGGSAGGMLVGAVANMAPELFAGMVAEVPFVDVLATMLDASLPLTPPEWPEWGNPLESEDDYRLIASYSPCDNVAALPYPPILALAGLTDPRVTYWEPAKWVARLRAKKAGDNPVLFRINMDSGHAGASGRFSRLEEIGYIDAFVLKVTGRTDTPPAPRL